MADKAQTRLPAFHRAATIDTASVNKDERTFSVMWSAGAEVPRIDWMTGQRYIEVLQVDDKSIRLDRFQSGRAPVLDSHNRFTLDNVIGVVSKDSVKVAGGEARATVRLSSREDVAGIVGDVADGIIGNVSPGYIVHAYREEVKDGQTYRYVTDWEPIELSFVPVGADPDAAAEDMARAAGDQKANMRTFPCTVERVAPADGRQGTIAPELIERAKARMRMRARAAGL